VNKRREAEEKGWGQKVERRQGGGEADQMEGTGESTEMKRKNYAIARYIGKCTATAKINC